MKIVSSNALEKKGSNGKRMRKEIHYINMLHCQAEKKHFKIREDRLFTGPILLSSEI